MSEAKQTEFEEFHWRDQLRYKCNRTWERGAPCEFDTYDLEEMRKHVAQPHGKIAVRLQRTSNIVGPDGRVVVYEDAPCELNDLQFKPEESL